MSRIKDIISLTSQMVEKQSVSGNEIEAIATLAIVDRYLQPCNLVRRNYLHNGIVSALWGTRENLMTPTYALNGHIDVVEADNPSQYIPVVKGHKLYGRGAGDMKGNVAAMVVAYREYVLSGGTDASLLLTSDEETGGFDGTRHIVENGFRPKVVFIPDGLSAFSIAESQKAPHHFYVRAKGPGGHAAHVFKVANPVNSIISVYTEMRARYAIATAENPWASTFEMTVMDTVNRAGNKIPSEVIAQFSWRWPLEHFSFEEGLADMQRACSIHGCEIVDELSHGWGEGCYTPRDNVFVQRWKSSIEDVLGRSVDYENLHGSSDARHFHKFGSLVIVTSGLGGGFHGQDEWVHLPSLVQLSEGITNFLSLQ